MGRNVLGSESAGSKAEATRTEVMFMKRNIVVVGIITVVSGAMRAEDHSQNQLQQELAAVLKMGDTLGRFTCRFSLPAMARRKCLYSEIQTLFRIASNDL
jgi:hypothetical protein